MSLHLTVHRGTRQIGGSCIEIVHPDGTRLILDAGRPLDAPEGATGLLPVSLDLSQPATVLISHPHQDHYGLLHELPADWPVWTGAASARLIAITSEIGHAPLSRPLRTWSSRPGPIRLGPFTVTPLLTDHSAFDAYMLLVEGADRRVLYTGDFRRHGRKGRLVDALMKRPPRNVDVLVCEGTNLGTDKPVMSEHVLEDDFVKLFERTAGRVFASWSGQNVDRTVTLYNAAKRTGRTLVLDLYTADVLDRITEGTRVPRAGFPNLKVVITAGLRGWYAKQGREDFIVRMARHGVSAHDVPDDAVVMLRRSLMHDYEKAGLAPTKADAFNYSMWRGYLAAPYHAEPLLWCKSAGAEIAYLHSSGHAAPEDLRAFAAAIAAKAVVPVHGENWDMQTSGFGPVQRLDDAEIWTLP
ncbi:MBL fold metallo-hydrolase [Methylobacterium sp. WL7]|uniref:MBL fold metallo-hydrolase n=1 Tax=Methylobacterium sp. WL7 TaxID=2603900 RepID=UPI0011C7D3C2|nr:MBL fold metallo-hydrolase [Methylobacterium sp. WL7]TXN41742.1 MBL fold metallo-hydrolase [Methylobacterium sp. WL7]